MVPVQREVFLNIPYDQEFEPFLMAYVVGLMGLGLKPRLALEISGTKNRIDRIIELIHSCPNSIHDLSRLESPRFNVPFELGIAYHYSLTGRHECHVFSTSYRKFQECLSDLKGIDIEEHRGDVEKLLGLLSGSHANGLDVPSMDEMVNVLRIVAAEKERLLKDCRSDSLFHLAVYRKLLLLTAEAWQSATTARG